MFKKRNIFMVSGVVLLIIITISVTFAFFSASQTNNETINGTVASASLDLKVTKKTKGSGLIPQLTDYLSSALIGTGGDGKESCIDDNGNTVCQVYEVTVTNNGTSNAKLYGKIELDADTFTNLKWEELDTVNTRKETPTTNSQTDNIITYNLFLEQAESKTYYIAIWLEENNSVQDDTDNGSFTGTISFNYPNGAGVTSTFDGVARCLSKGTKITMKDGSYKNIEDIKIGDEVLTYNHLNGIYESQKVYYLHKGQDKTSAFTLHFSNGDNLSIVGVHDLFSLEEHKYVRISLNNLENYIGKHFYNTKSGKYVELKNVTKEKDLVEYYSIYTRYNNNSIANNMLSVPDDVDWFLNIYDFDDDMNANKDTLAKDISRYGLYEYKGDDVFEDYDLYNLKYLNIIIGKGLATENELKAIRNEYNTNK